MLLTQLASKVKFIFGSANQKSSSIIVGLLISIMGFLLHWNLELKLERFGVFQQYNVLFDADPNVVLHSFTNLGDEPNIDLYYMRQLAHPNVPTFFAAPIRVLSKGLTIVSPGKFDDTKYLHRQCALVIVPLMAALYYWIVYRLFLRLTLSLLLASLFTLLALVSFTQLLFGSIPELFAINNLAIALAYLLFLVSKDGRERQCFMAWTAVGMFATGVTITNLVPMAILFWLSEIYQHRGVWISIARVVGWAALVLALTFALQDIMLGATGLKRPSLSHEFDWIQTFGTKNAKNAVKKFFTFPEVVVNSIIAPEPKQIPNAFAMQMNPSARYAFKFSFDHLAQKSWHNAFFSVRNLIGMVLLLLLLLPIRQLAREDRSLFLLSWGSGLVVFYNMIFHSLWGSDRFLYSQHWHTPLVFLGALLVATKLHVSWQRCGLVAAVIGVTAINNWTVGRTLLEALSAR